MADINNINLPPLPTLPPLSPTPPTPIIAPVTTPLLPPLTPPSVTTTPTKSNSTGFYVITGIIILLLITACLFLAFKPKEIMALFDKITKKNTSSLVSTTKKISVIETKVTPETASPSAVVPTIPKLQTKDCGSLDSTHIAISPPLTAQEKINSNCFMNAATTCEKAIIKIGATGYGNSIMEISNKEIDKCIISVTIIEKPTVEMFSVLSNYNTCKLPIDKLLIPLISEIKKQNMPEVFILGSLGFFIKGTEEKLNSDGWYQQSAENAITKEKIIYECK